MTAGTPRCHGGRDFSVTRPLLCSLRGLARGCTGMRTASADMKLASKGPDLPVFAQRESGRVDWRDTQYSLVEGLGTRVEGCLC